MSSVITIFKTIAAAVSAKLEARASDPLAVYFDHGVYDTVNKNLVSKDGSITMKGKKYPLIWLRTPLRESRPQNADYSVELSELELFILMGTSQNESDDTRIAKYFEPTLRPIYRELLTQIDYSNAFQVLSADSITHEMTEWTYSSTTDGKANLFNDCIDCIQVKIKRLRIH